MGKVGSARGILLERQTRKAWKPNLHLYEEQTALRFSSEGELDAFIAGLWSDAHLRAMPRAHVGDNTVIVPAEAIETLRDHCGCVFAGSPVVPAAAATRRT